MNSIELYKPNNSTLNKLSRFFLKMPIKPKEGLTSININHKRNSMIKKFKILVENKNDQEKFNNYFNLYIEALNDCMMNKIYKRVKLEIANEYEKNILSEYYYILKLKEEHYDEYNCRKQKFLMNLDYENIESDKKIFDDFKIVYKYNINKIYSKLLNLKNTENDVESNEYILNIIKEYNDDKFVGFILKDEGIEPYTYEITEDNSEINTAISNKQKYEIFLNIAKNIFIKEINESFIDYINNLILKEEEIIKGKNKRKIKLKVGKNDKKAYKKIKENKKDDEK